jgi:hypothetical protein
MNWKYEIAKRKEKFWLWLACRMPKRLTLWCFVLVMGSDGNGPGEEYKIKYDYWCEKYGLSK